MSPSPIRPGTILDSRRRRKFVVLVMLITLALSGCTDDPSESGPPATSEPALSEFYEQDLQFGSCANVAATPTEDQIISQDAFECARLTVPMNYSDPGGREVEIAVLRVPASGDADTRVGSLVINPGGPGGSGMVGAALSSAGLADSPLLESFDLVGFDPRGVGASKPSIHCFSDEDKDAGRGKATLLGTSGAWTVEDTQALVSSCVSGSGGTEVLAAVGTRDVARDMDVLRAALGDEKLTFLGQSYGTRLGAIFAEQFPDNVRAMVLDGAFDPLQGTAERRIALHASFQRSFELMAASCAESPDCPLGTDPAQATSVFQRLVQPLVHTPVPSGAGREADFYQVTGGVGSGLYTRDYWPIIISGLSQLKNEGRADQLVALNDNLNGRGLDGAWLNVLDSNYAVTCVDEERRSPSEEADLRARIAEVNPWLDSGEDFAGTTRDACEFWPAEPTLGTPYAQDITELPSTLVISITGDASTPYEAGVSLADSLGSTLLTVEGERHTVALEGISPCVNTIVADYLIDLDLPDGEIRCSL